MNTKNIKLLMLLGVAIFFAVTSCVNDLDTLPLDEDVTTGIDVYSNPDNYVNVLAKVYAGLATTGQNGPDGNPDLGGIDEGFSSYLRGYWNLQELTTDEAVTGWGDDGLQDLHSHVWDASNDFVKGLYYRVFYQIAIANEFIRETAESRLNDRGFSEADKEKIATYHYEARFLRALSYWHALDMFRNVPFVTEEDGVGSYFPEQIDAAGLFDYIETELLAIEPNMVAPMNNEYARADQAAVWMLLANLYLNAEVYINESKYTEAITYAQKVIDAGYVMDNNYEHLFMADNHTADGIIFSVAFDGVNTQTWGATTFIINGGIGGSMTPADYGVQNNWGGHRTTSAFVQKFPQYATVEQSVVMKAVKMANEYPVLHCPGDYQGWDAANDSTVIYSRNSDNQYEGYLYFSGAAEFKFDVNGDWSLNYGDNDADGTLEQEGANIAVAEAGYYKINVDLDAMTYTMEKTDWGVIGDATADGWDSDQNMFVDENGILTAELSLGVGGFKFRANDDWPINLGDTGADGILEYEGDNISIEEAGKYKVQLFLTAADYTYSIEKASSDGRAMFYTDGQSLEIDMITDFTNGYAITKWKNITSTGEAGSNPTYVDTDYPIFRIAEANLIYAEAVVRGGSGGSMATAVDLINDIRERAYGNDAGNITEADLTLDFIIDERARELYWEGRRRTDLIRFGLFAGDAYIWPWKGGVKEGVGINAKFRLFPIPSSDIIANPSLTQNTGY